METVIRETLCDQTKLDYMRDYYQKNKSERNRKRGLYYYREKYGLPLNLVENWKSCPTKHRHLLSLLEDVDEEILAWAILSKRIECLKHMKGETCLPILGKLCASLEEKVGMRPTGADIGRPSSALTKVGTT